LRSIRQGMPAAAAASDKLYRFAYEITHLFQLTRWERTFRLVS
jgi:hypothetical protein